MTKQIAKRLSLLPRPSRVRNGSDSSIESTTSTLKKKPTKLHKLIAEEEWEKCEERIKKKGAQKRRQSEASVWILQQELGNERLAMHQACAHKPPLDVVKALHTANPHAVRLPEKKYGVLPLHTAVQRGARRDVIEYLVEVYPEAAEKKDDFGLLPLHLACTEGASVAVVETLLAAYPDAAGVEDNKGYTPLMYAEVSFHPNKAEIADALRRNTVKGSAE